MRATGYRSSIRVRPMEPRDLRNVAALEAACFGADAWPRAAFAEVLHAFREARGGRGGLWVAADGEDGEVLGYAGLEMSALRGEADVINIAVGARHRRRGVGRLLLERVLRRCRQRGVELLWLRVRASNRSARRFYNAMGFDRRGTFADYYRDPTEPAIVMAMALE